LPFKRSVIATSLVLLALAVSPVGGALWGLRPAHAADAPPTAIVLIDGSGSMWGKLGADANPKFDVVRNVVREALPGLRPDIKFGLASFGHRRRGTCTDAEVILPPQTLAPDQVAGIIGKMNAMGKGPLVLGLRQAAAAIGNAAPATIIVINDDVDNCGQDLCTAAAEIAKANPALVVHTIGLGFDEAKIQQLGCLARATNGKLFNAPDAAGVASAFDQIVKLAHLDAGTPPEAAKSESAEAAPSNVPKQEPGLYLSAGLGPDSATLESPVRWRVAKPGPEGVVVREAKAPSLVEKLPAGTYDVEARLGLASARQTIEVAAEEPTPARLNLNAGVLRMLARPAKDKPPLPIATYMVAPVTDDPVAATPIWIGREAQPEVVLPAGEYQITAENGTARQTERIKIAAATGTTFTALLSTGRLELSAARGTDASEPLTDGLTFIVYEDDPDSPGGRREVARSAAPNPAFTLPAGTYYVTARTANAEVRDQIAIGAGDSVKRILPFGLARLQLTATLDGKPAPADLPLVYTVFRIDGDQHEVLRTVAKDPALELSTGRYRVEASVSATNVRAAADYAVASGQNLKATIKLDAGHVTLNLLNRPAQGDVYWEIKNAEQRTVLRTSQPQPAALLAPGRYTVMAESGDQQLSASFEVKAGENRTIDISG
jgi:Ca-activated chloride channel family protein